MQKNIGTTDRLIRLAIAILLLLFAIWQESWIIGAISLFTFYEALASWCVFYQLIGKNSCPINHVEPRIKKIETADAPKAIGPYSQAVYTNQLLFVSGQLPLDPTTGKIVDAEIHLQVNRVLDNIDAILKAAGCSWNHVLKCEIFLKDLNDFALVNQEYAKRVNSALPPARQTIQAAKLPLDALVEISCIALLSPLTEN